jgi:hypothetical protein
MSLPLAEETNFQRLIERAQRRFDANLLKVEAQVIEHSVRSAEFLVPNEPLPRPTIRAEFLRWLATDPDAESMIDPKGIRVLAATIPNDLDLRGCQISHQLYFHACEFHGRVNLMSASTRSLYLIFCQASKGIDADGIRVEGAVRAVNLKACSAIRLLGARIDGNLELDGTTLGGADAPLILDGARILGSVFMRDGLQCSGEIRMLNAEIEGDLGIIGGKVISTERALTLDKVIVKGLISLSGGFQAVGKISLSGGQVFGDLTCSGASLSAQDVALDLATATIRGHVYLNQGFTSNAQVSFHSARVDNSVDFSGATITANGMAVTFEKATIRGNVFFCDSFKSSGTVCFPGAHLCGDLVIDQATLPALYCLNLSLDGELVWTNIQNAKQTGLWLNGASVKNLRDDRDSWPKAGGLHVGGFTYKNATLHKTKTGNEYKQHSHAAELGLNAKDRIEWLNLQPDTEIAQAQPWLQLADLLKASGDTGNAKRAIFEMRRHQAAQSWLLLRWWKTFAYARLQQEPLWIVASIALFTSIGLFVFCAADRDHAMAPTSESHYAPATGSTPIAYPTFCPLTYSLENALPLVKLGQDEKWAPNPGHAGSHWFTRYAFLAGFRWSLILLGWAQATVLVSALAGRFKD